MFTILLVGLDETLLTTRGLVLRQLLADVVKASPEAALELLKDQHFDLAIVCHTTTLQHSREIVSAAHSATPRIPVVQVLGAPFVNTNYDDLNADATADWGPHQLLHAATRTLRMFTPSQTSGLVTKATVEIQPT